jgi:hypothetical protein
MRRPKLTLPQPKVFKAVYAMRLRMQRKAEKLGWGQYLAGVNGRAGHLLGKPPAPSPAKHGREPVLRSFGPAPSNRTVVHGVSARAR